MAKQGFRIVRGRGAGWYYVQRRRRFLWWAWWAHARRSPTSEYLAVAPTLGEARRLLAQVRLAYENPHLPEEVVYEDLEDK